MSPSTGGLTVRLGISTLALTLYIFVFVFNIVTGLNVSEFNQMYEILG